MVFKALRATYLYLCVREKKKTNKELTKERKEKPKQKDFPLCVSPWNGDLLTEAATELL